MNLGRSHGSLVQGGIGGAGGVGTAGGTGGTGEGPRITFIIDGKETVFTLGCSMLFDGL
jgi:hypothetical protein